MQKLVEEFNKLKSAHQTKMPVSARLLDIQSELGELAKEYLKPTKYGTSNFEVTDDFKLEFGDVLYSLLSLAEETGVEAEECLKMVLAKYKARLEKNNKLGSDGIV